jgi:signal transduction histidine kinase
MRLCTLTMLIASEWSGALSCNVGCHISWSTVLKAPMETLGGSTHTGVATMQRTGRRFAWLECMLTSLEHKTVERERLQLSGRLINAQEQERGRLARELHDDFCQRVALLCLEMNSLAQVTDNPLASKRLSELKEEVEGLGEDLCLTVCIRPSWRF